MRIDKYILPSIIRALTPTWEYYMLAKGRLRETVVISNEFSKSIAVDVWLIEMTKKIIFKHEKKYNCKIEVDMVIGISGDDFMRDTKTVLFQVRSNFA